MKPLKSAEQFNVDEFVSVKPATVEIPLAQPQQFSADAFVSVNEVSDRANDMPKAINKAGISRWLGVGLSLVLLVALLQWAEFVQDSLNSSVVQGAAALALTGFGVAALTKICWSSWRGRRQHAERQSWRQQGAAMQNSLQYGQATALCQRMLKQTPASAEAFYAQQNPQLSDAETLQLFDLLVLQPLDQQAAVYISAAAKQAGMAVALSPFALADMALVSWRAWRLLAELSALYGVQIGALQRLALIKKFANLLFWTGATELAIDIGGDFLGVELSSKLSARAGQGVLAGLMLARLGRFIQQELRPLPLVTQQATVQPLLQSLLQRLLQRPPAQ
ncbi:TIGR01620 family protein [Rheinheimera sp.]|uniref:TIGR01620 family protein n=1 Tax=Rheinheimera sp. TaxID=1869214 RepID=UPI003D2A49E6